MTQNPKMSLDVSAPWHVPAVLAFVAQKYREDASELQAAHQTDHAGREWEWLARELEKLDARYRKYLAKEGHTEFK